MRDRDCVPGGRVRVHPLHVTGQGDAVPEQAADVAVADRGMIRTDQKAAAQKAQFEMADARVFAGNDDGLGGDLALARDSRVEIVEQVRNGCPPPRRLSHPMGEGSKLGSWNDQSSGDVADGAVPGDGKAVQAGHDYARGSDIDGHPPQCRVLEELHEVTGCGGKTLRVESRTVDVDC